MEASRLDRVHVDVAGDIVEISWTERDALLKEIRNVAGLETVVRKFEAVGATRPVELNADEHEQLLVALEFSEALYTASELPDGIARLLTALIQKNPSGDYA